MSLILDALKKANDERADDSEPNDNIEHHKQSPIDLDSIEPGLQNSTIHAENANTDLEEHPEEFDKKSKLKPILAGTGLAALFLIGYALTPNSDSNIGGTHSKTPEKNTQQVSSDKISAAQTAQFKEKEALSAPKAEDQATTQEKPTPETKTTVQNTNKDTQPELSSSTKIRTTNTNAEQKLIAAQYQQEQQRSNPDIDTLYQDDNIRSTVAEENAATQSSKSYSTNKSDSSKSQAAKQTKQAKTIESGSSLNDVDNLAFYAAVMFIKGLPHSMQRDIPTLMYGGHYYQPNGQSSVMLNGKTYKEGSRIGGGIKVEKILKDGVLLSKGQTQFKMMALNSWLNY